MERSSLGQEIQRELLFFVVASELWYITVNKRDRLPILLCYRRAQAKTERAPELLGSKCIKQAGSNSADSCPKAEP
jgi:hypothetical protein